VSIIKWYKKDFINDLRANGHPAERGLIDYVAGIAMTSAGPMATTSSSGITTGI